MQAALADRDKTARCTARRLANTVSDTLEQRSSDTTHNLATSSPASEHYRSSDHGQNLAEQNPSELLPRPGRSPFRDRLPYQEQAFRDHRCRSSRTPD